ncbi:MAG: hypothetical protein AAFP90_03435 [Planctomycetota bacterium]
MNPDNETPESDPLGDGPDPFDPNADLLGYDPQTPLIDLRPRVTNPSQEDDSPMRLVWWIVACVLLPTLMMTVACWWLWIAYQDQLQKKQTEPSGVSSVENPVRVGCVEPLSRPGFQTNMM